MTVSLQTLAAFLEERTPGCEAMVVRDAINCGVRASIYVSEQAFQRNMTEALRRMPHVDWQAFVARSRRAVGPYASKARMRKAAGL